MDNINIFCNNPIGIFFRDMDNDIQRSFYIVAKHCLEYNVGDINLAKKILTYYRYGKLSDDQKRDFESLLIGLKLLTSRDFSKGQQKDFPMLSVYIKNKDFPIYSFTFNQYLKDMFTVYQSYRILGIDKELELTYNDLREELLYNIWKHKINIDTLFLYSKYNNTESKELLYSRHIGIVRGELPCLKCVKILEKYNLDCENISSDNPYSGKKDLDKCINLCKNKKCLQNIRKRPKYLNKKIIHKILRTS